MQVCEQCGKSFTAKKPHARFCSDACRMKFHRPTLPAAEGPQGTVKIVRRIKTGVSVTLHFTDECQAERAIKTPLGAPARLVSQQEQDPS